MITKQFSFCYGHRLPDYDGKCVRQHGHNAVLDVTVSRIGGNPSYPSMVVDFGELKALVAPILEQFDHHDINERHPALLPPTCENMVRWFASEIALVLPDGVQLERLRLTETPTSWSEWTR